MRGASRALVVALVLGAGTPAAAKLPIYHSPGYRGTTKAPPRTPPPPITLATGDKPNVLVDAAGAAHIVWNEPHDDGPGLLRYCRPPRRATPGTPAPPPFPAAPRTGR